MQILLISENQATYTFLEKTISSKGYALVHTSRKDKFPVLVRDRDIRIIVVEVDGPETSDYALLKAIKNFDPLLEVIIVGPEASGPKMIEAISLGAEDYLVRPLDEKPVLSLLKKIEDKILLRKETYQLEKKLAQKYTFEDMVSRNYSMLDVFSLIERLAKHSISVIVTGDTGTGKEMVARALHNLGPRRDKKFVVCDCTAVPETLFESEVFGFEKGTFTGADKSKPGILKQADKGTIFFDEISEIPISAQTKLLRAIEERQFRPLGSNEVVDVDVRVICATNRNLREEIKKGTFREDLFHRINVAEIHLPTLKQRKEDIPLLCSHFLDRYNSRYHKNVRGISQRAKKVLASYDWPGNVRELENLIERAMMITREQFIDIKDLPENLLIYQSAEESGAAYPYVTMSLEEIEKRHIQEVLRHTNYNKQRTAKMLKLTRPALYRKLKKFNLPF
jgi:DNA-binding NtrC family response regulator